MPKWKLPTLVPEAIYKERGAMAWREDEERSEGEEKSPLVESVGNLTSMLSPRTEIEPRRWLVTNFGCRRILVFFLFLESKELAICTCISSSKSTAWPSRLKFVERVVSLRSSLFRFLSGKRELGDRGDKKITPSLPFLFLLSPHSFARLPLGSRFLPLEQTKRKRLLRRLHVVRTFAD